MLGLQGRARIAAALLTAAMLTAACAAAVAETAAAGPHKRGIDVSRFQGAIDWEKVGTTKTKFVWAAASRGRGNDCKVAPDDCGADPFYAANYAGARAAGLAVGPYHRAFAQGRTRERARRDARREAHLFIGQVGTLLPGDLRPVLDVETPFTRLSPRRLRLWINTWLDRVERKLGARPLIYTNNSSWQATGNVRRFARRGYALWVANYNVPSPLVPAENWGGLGWSVWQHTSTGSVRGVRGNVDKNKLQGGLGSISVG